MTSIERYGMTSVEKYGESLSLEKFLDSITELPTECRVQAILDEAKSKFDQCQHIKGRVADWLEGVEGVTIYYIGGLLEAIANEMKSTKNFEAWIKEHWSHAYGTQYNWRTAYRVLNAQFWGVGTFSKTESLGISAFYSNTLGCRWLESGHDRVFEEARNLIESGQLFRKREAEQLLAEAKEARRLSGDSSSTETSPDNKDSKNDTIIEVAPEPDDGEGWEDEEGDNDTEIAPPKKEQDNYTTTPNATQPKKIDKDTVELQFSLEGFKRMEALAEKCGVSVRRQIEESFTALANRNLELEKQLEEKQALIDELTIGKPSTVEDETPQLSRKWLETAKTAQCKEMAQACGATAVEISSFNASDIKFHYLKPYLEACELGLIDKGDHITLSDLRSKLADYYGGVAA